MTNSIDSILRQLFKSLDCSEYRAEMLDPVYYHDADLFELEMERPFRTEWIGVARADRPENRVTTSPPIWWESRF